MPQDDARRAKAIDAFNTPPLFMACPMRKAPHRTEAEAQHQADRLNAARPDGHGTNYPFKCPHCDRWHVGRPHKGKTVH